MSDGLTLSPQVISLIHHVELQKAGWWDRALEHLVLAVLWLHGKPLAAPQIADGLAKSLGVRVHSENVEARLEGLKKIGAVVQQGDAFAVSETERQELEEGVKETEALEERVKARFTQTLTECCPDFEPLPVWESFYQDLLNPFVLDMGARTYEIISATVTQVDSLPHFQAFLERHGGDQREQLRKALVAFLDPKDPDVREFILRLLNSYFFVEAGNLRPETVEALNSLIRPTGITVLVDTNFLFSILGLHDNPSNEAARALMTVANEIRSKIPIRFEVAPSTIREAQAVLTAVDADFRGLRVPPNVAKVALRTELSGIARKYVEESQRVPGGLASDSYFEPYLRDLPEIAASKGILLCPDDPSGLRAREDVQTDTENQKNYEEWRWGDGGKGPREIEHDICLWHHVNDTRPATLNSPLHATTWIVTVDYRFMSFDRYKRRKSESAIPVCIHPTTFIQMLQFWIPRTQEFEEAVVGTLRLPFLFQRFDPKAEQITINILQSISRFENLSDIDEDLAAKILVNDVLRHRIERSGSEEERRELIHEVLIDETRRVSGELEVARDKVRALDSELAEEKARKGEAAKALEAKSAEAKRTKEELANAQKTMESLEARLRQLEAADQQRSMRERREDERRRFTLVAGLALLVIAAVSPVSAYLLAAQLNFSSWRLWVLILAGLVAVWVLSVDAMGHKRPAVADSRVFRLLHAVKGLLVFLVITLGVGGGLVSSVIYDQAGDFLSTEGEPRPTASPPP